MSDPKAHEVVPQAIVSEIPIEGLPTIQAANLAKEVRKGIAKGNFREGLAKITEVQEVRYEEFPKKTTTFGIEINDNPQSLDYGKVKRTQEEEALLLKMKQFEGLSKKFFERGYDGLESGEKTMIRAKILEQARRLPQLAPQIARLEAAGQGDAFAERYIKDPAFSAELKNKINELLEQPFDNNVIEKFEQFMEAKNDKNLVDQEMRVLEAQLANAQSTLNSFKRTLDGSAETNAANARRMDELRNDPNNNPALRIQKIASLEQQLIEAEVTAKGAETDMQTAMKYTFNNNPLEDSEYKAAKRRVPELQRILLEAQTTEGGTTSTKNKVEDVLRLYPGQISELKDLIETTERKAREMTEGTGTFTELNTTLKDARADTARIRQEIATLKGQEDELKALENEERISQERVKSLEAEKREILERQQLKESASQRAQREYDAAKEAHLLDEKTFTEKMGASWGRASNEIISQQMEQAFRIFGEELEGAREVSKSEHERVFLTTIQNTYLGPEKTRHKGFGPFRRTETYRPLDKSAVLRDYSLLLRQGDVPFVRSLFSRTTNPDTNQCFTDDEINDIFEKNPDLIKKARPEAVKQLLARKVLLGGMTHEDIYIVSTSEWGKDMIQQGLDQNVEFRRAVEQVMGAEALSRHGFADRFKQEMAKHPFWWSLLLGIPAGMKAFSTPPEGEELNRQ